MKQVNTNPFFSEVEPKLPEGNEILDQLPPGEIKQLSKYVEKNEDYLCKLLVVIFKMLIQNRELFFKASETVRPKMGRAARRLYVHQRLRGRSQKEFAALMKEEKRLVDKLCPEYAWHRQKYWHEKS